MHHSGERPCRTRLSCEISPKATSPFFSSTKTIWKAAFLPRDPSDRDAFMTHWKRILGDPTLTKKTILWNGQVVGSIGSFLWEGKPQVTYWLGKTFWGM